MKKQKNNSHIYQANSLNDFLKIVDAIADEQLGNSDRKEDTDD